MKQDDIGNGYTRFACGCRAPAGGSSPPASHACVQLRCERSHYSRATKAGFGLRRFAKWHCSEPVSRRASKPCHVGLSRTAHGAGAVDGGSAAIRRRPGTPNAALAIEHAPLPEGGSRQKYRVRDTRGCLARPYHRWGAGSTSSQPCEPIARPQTRLVRHRDRQ